MAIHRLGLGKSLLQSENSSVIDRRDDNNSRWSGGENGDDGGRVEVVAVTVEVVVMEVVEEVMTVEGVAIAEVIQVVCFCN